MAQYALPPGAVRRRAVFGLLDADGWTWATIKATFWFLLIIFLLGYVPDRAYYFTVSPTVDLGFNAISPVNLCPAENKTPALSRHRPGAVIPWEASPDELALPAAVAPARWHLHVAAQIIYLVGGRDRGRRHGERPDHDRRSDGNLTPWAEGPALPEPRIGRGRAQPERRAVRHRRQ